MQLVRCHTRCYALRIAWHGSSRGIDAKDWVVRRNRFKGGYRCFVGDREVLAAARGNFAPGPLGLVASLAGLL